LVVPVELGMRYGVRQYFRIHGRLRRGKAAILADQGDGD
jgi:hypothetical protein